MFTNSVQTILDGFSIPALSSALLMLGAFCADIAVTNKRTAAVVARQTSRTVKSTSPPGVSAY
jgi:hypothetical protein